MGSYRLVTDKEKHNTRVGRPAYPTGVVSVTDTLTITNEMTNAIPDKSWMLYLLEIFNGQSIALELNLICQFDGQDYFEVIFRGINQYRFNNILPVVGRSYTRQILLNPQKKTVRFLLRDQYKMEYEIYDLSIKNIPSFIFEGSREFTGIEWWNKMKGPPYPIKYEVKISQLLFGVRDDPFDAESAIFYPYTALLPVNDGSGTSYPVSLRNLRTQDDGSISYHITSGRSHTGIRYNC